MQFANSPFAFAESVKTERSPASFWTAIGAHVILLAAIFALAAGRVTTITKGRLLAPTIEPPPLHMPVTAPTDTGSGSQGASDTAAAGLGHPPTVDAVHLAPPVIQTTMQPLLTVQPTVAVQMPSNNMPNLGVANANTPSIHIGVGKGSTAGDGDGHSVGIGSDAGPGTGTGLLHAGIGGVHNPVLVYQVEPEFSEEARRTKFSGNVQVYLWVDEQGHTSHVRVLRGVGMGLDEKAVEAVRQYRFKPAMKDGKPVKVDMYIDVVFSIF